MNPFVNVILNITSKLSANVILNICLFGMIDYNI